MKKNKSPSTACANGVKNGATVEMVLAHIGSNVTTDEVMRSLRRKRVVVGDFAVFNGQRSLSATVRKETSLPRSDKATGNKLVNEYEEDVNDSEEPTAFIGEIGDDHR